jgi:phage-related tail fiber protein
MSTFGGVHFTNKGKSLQAKALTGVQLSFTRLAVGDGSLTGQAIVDLSALIHEVKTLPITTLKNTNDGKVTIGGVLTNQDLASGFYWREIGLFATDPDLGEFLYCYGNAAALAEYIPAGGGADLLEKQVNVVAIVGDATNISAIINNSLVYASYEDLIALEEKVNGITVFTTSTISPTITKSNDIWFKILQ